MKSIRDKIEYQQEMASWKVLFIRAKKAIDSVLSKAEQEKETERLKQSWEGIKKVLKNLYE